MSTINELYIKAIRGSSVFNPDVQVAPACILWPDSDRQWEAVIPRLQSELPEVLTLGDYAPDKKTGPAIWLRCVIAGKIDDVSLPEERTPILYLPGVSRKDLSAVESCPEHLKPLAELQYRGVIWSQINSKDWTILAFLKSDQGGLGLDVAADNDAKNSMQLALYRLLDEEVELLKGKRLDKDYFNTLLTGGDPVRDLLLWLDQGNTFKGGRDENAWIGFVEVCKSQLAFDPDKDGNLKGAELLAVHKGPWFPVWERFCEAPKRYPNIPALIRKCKAPQFDLFTDADSAGGWPQWNEDQEKSLHLDLLALKNILPLDARKKLLDMNNRHGCRRKLVWAELGEAPLAMSLEFLAVLAETTINGLTAGNIEDLTAGYQNSGWRADNAVILALSDLEKSSDIEAVSTAIRAIYMTWAEESARYLQKIVNETGYPGGTVTTVKKKTYKKNECLLFVDGLRFDTAKRLTELLSQQGFEIEERLVWTALPSVTATGKPAVAPVNDKIIGEDTSADFEPSVTETGQSLKGGYHLKKLLTDNGWKILDNSDSGDGQGNAWCEYNNIDHDGHEKGWKLAKYIDGYLLEVCDKIMALLSTGWKSVTVVTDHGWFLLPGGLPKIELPSVLSENKWGRCAVIKPGACTKERLYPWFWNPNQHFALADGISCYKMGLEYTHGGLSFQECLVLELTINGNSSSDKSLSIEITDISWVGLRCNVAVDGQFSGLSVDVRIHPGEPASSVVMSIKPLKDNGTASVVIDKDDLEGQDATLILLDPKGEVVAQVSTLIGGGKE